MLPRFVPAGLGVSSPATSSVESSSTSRANPPSTASTVGISANSPSIASESSAGRSSAESSGASPSGSYSSVERRRARRSRRRGLVCHRNSHQHHCHARRDRPERYHYRVDPFAGLPFHQAPARVRIGTPVSTSDWAMTDHPQLAGLVTAHHRLLIAPRRQPAPTRPSTTSSATASRGAATQALSKRTTPGRYPGRSRPAEVSRGRGRVPRSRRRPRRRCARARPRTGPSPGPMHAASSSSGSRLTWVVDAGWVTMLSGPPSDVASRTTRTSSTNARPAS